MDSSFSDALRTFCKPLEDIRTKSKFGEACNHLWLLLLYAGFLRLFEKESSQKLGPILCCIAVTCLLFFGISLKPNEANVIPSITKYVNFLGLYLNLY